MSWKYKVWKTAARAAALCGAGGIRPGVRVLCYHAVETALAEDPYGLSVPLSAFKRQMELLASGRFGKPMALGQARLDDPRAQVCVTFDDGYRDTLTQAAPVLAALGLPFTVCVTPKFIESREERYLTPAQLEALAASPGAEIGAHGLTHARLADCEDARLERELAGSREWLERRLKRPVTVMTYPHGSADRRVRAAAAKAGFTAAGCSRYGLNEPGRDPLLLCRTEIVAWDDDRAFEQKVSGCWDWYRFRHKDPAS